MIISVLIEKSGWDDHRQALDAALFQISLDVLKQVVIKFQALNGNKTLWDEFDNLKNSQTNWSYKMICKFFIS